MSKQLINKYRNKIHKIKQFSGARSEGAISRAFGDLLGEYADKLNLMLVEQVEVNSTKNTRIRPDGVLKNAMQLDFGFWEAKKADVDLDREIQDKINKGYPLTNTIFEDSRRAVLFQENTLVLMRRSTMMRNSNVCSYRFLNSSLCRSRNLTRHSPNSRKMFPILSKVCES